jgi:phage host-nuclease inhibitor protein Gam
MATKKKQPAVSITSWADVDAALRRLAFLEPKKAQLEAGLTGAVQLSKDSYEPQIKPLAETIEGLTTAISEFVLANKADLGDGETKTRVLGHGSVSIRLTPPALKTKGKVTWKQVLAVAQSLPKKFRELIVKQADPTIDKDALKAALSKGMIPDVHVTALGVQLHQEEKVYYELKAEQAS